MANKNEQRLEALEKILNEKQEGVVIFIQIITRKDEKGEMMVSVSDERGHGTFETCIGYKTWAIEHGFSDAEIKEVIEKAGWVCD